MISSFTFTSDILQKMPPVDVEPQKKIQHTSSEHAHNIIS